MASVFLSYRRSDSAAAAGRIADQLKQRFGDASVFLDVDAIPLGVDFRKYVNQRLDKSDVFLCVIGHHWLDARDDSGGRRIDNSSDTVYIEVSSALARGEQVPVIPVLVESAPMPKEAELPPAIRDLAYRNAIEVRSDSTFAGQMERLITSIEGLPAKEPSPAPSEPRPAQESSRALSKQVTAAEPAQKSRRKLLVYGGAGLGAVAVALVAWLFPWYLHAPPSTLVPHEPARPTPTQSEKPPPPPPTKPTNAESTARLLWSNPGPAKLDVDQTQELKLQLLSDDRIVGGDPLRDYRAAWSVDPSDVATVEGAGIAQPQGDGMLAKLTAKKPGNATVTASLVKGDTPALAVQKKVVVTVPAAWTTDAQKDYMKVDSDYRSKSVTDEEALTELDALVRNDRHRYALEEKYYKDAESKRDQIREMLAEAAKANKELASPDLSLDEQSKGWGALKTRALNVRDASSIAADAAKRQSALQDRILAEPYLTSGPDGARSRAGIETCLKAESEKCSKASTQFPPGKIYYALTYLAPRNGRLYVTVSGPADAQPVRVYPGEHRVDERSGPGHTWGAFSVSAAGSYTVNVYNTKKELLQKHQITVR